MLLFGFRSTGGIIRLDQRECKKSSIGSIQNLKNQFGFHFREFLFRKNTSVAHFCQFIDFNNRRFGIVGGGFLGFYFIDHLFSFFHRFRVAFLGTGQVKIFESATVVEMFSHYIAKGIRTGSGKYGHTEFADHGTYAGDNFNQTGIQARCAAAWCTEGGIDFVR